MTGETVGGTQVSAKRAKRTAFCPTQSPLKDYRDLICCHTQCISSDRSSQDTRIPGEGTLKPTVGRESDCRVLCASSSHRTLLNISLSRGFCRAELLIFFLNSTASHYWTLDFSKITSGNIFHLFHFSKHNSWEILQNPSQMMSTPSRDSLLEPLDLNAFSQTHSRTQLPTAPACPLL